MAKGDITRDTDLTDEMRADLYQHADTFGVGDWDQDDIDSGRSFDFDDFQGVIDESYTVGELIDSLNEEFDLNCEETIIEILDGTF